MISGKKNSRHICTESLQYLHSPQDRQYKLMRKPDENRVGQPVDDVSEVDSKQAGTLRPATEISIWKPRGQENVPLTFLLGNHSSWCGRFLGLGIGALAMMAAVLVSAIVIAINDPLPGLQVAMNVPTDINQTEEPISFDSFSPSILPAAVAEPVRQQVRAKLAGPDVRLAAHRPQRSSRSSSRLRIGNFVPTKLVIYAEKGVIKRRIEPWL